jgi:hypothetical protein
VVFTAVNIQAEVFWDVTPCSFLAKYQRFGRSYCLHLQGENEGRMVLRNVGILHHLYM